MESPIRTSAWNPCCVVGVRSVSSASNTRFKKSMNSGPGGSRYGVMVRNPVRNTTAFTLDIVIRAFLSNSALRLVLKSGLGKARRPAAIPSNSVSAGSADAGIKSGFARIPLIA